MPGSPSTVHPRPTPQGTADERRVAKRAMPVNSVYSAFAARDQFRRPAIAQPMLGNVTIGARGPMSRGVRALRLSRLCPASTVVGFDRGKHAKLCLHVAKRAEHAFAHTSAVGFPGPVSRARQCAHLDAFRDLVAGVLHEASRQGHLRRRKRDTRPITASTITMITTMVQSMTRPFRGERVQLAGGPPGHPRSTRELWRLW